MATPGNISGESANTNVNIKQLTQIHNFSTMPQIGQAVTLNFGQGNFQARVISEQETTNVNKEYYKVPVTVGDTPSNVTYILAERIPGTTATTNSSNTNSSTANATGFTFPKGGVAVTTSAAQAGQQPGQSGKSGQNQFGGPITVGQEFTALGRDWINALFKGNVSSLAFWYMMIVFTVGFLIGSINRIGYCSVPGLQMDRCNNSILILFALGMLILSVMSYTREPEDPNADFFTYPQSWVMISSGACIAIMMMMFSFRRSGVTAYGDYGAYGGVTSGVPIGAGSGYI